MRTRINTLAACIVLAGGAFLATPPAAAAYADTSRVCCDGVNNTRCCGDECKASSSGCSACSGFWGCLLF